MRKKQNKIILLILTVAVGINPFQGFANEVLQGAPQSSNGAIGIGDYEARMQAKVSFEPLALPQRSFISESLGIISALEKSVETSYESNEKIISNIISQASQQKLANQEELISFTPLSRPALSQKEVSTPDIPLEVNNDYAKKIIASEFNKPEEEEKQDTPLQRFLNFHFASPYRKNVEKNESKDHNFIFDVVNTNEKLLSIIEKETPELKSPEKENSPIKALINAEWLNDDVKDKLKNLLNWEEKAEYEVIDQVLIDPKLASLHMMHNPPKNISPFLRWLLYRTQLSEKHQQKYIELREKIQQIYINAKNKKGKLLYRDKIVNPLIPPLIDMGGAYALVTMSDDNKQS